MFIAGIILFLAESLFLVYLIRKQREFAKREKVVAERESRVKRRKEFLDNYKAMLEKDYKKDLEDRKTAILKEFEEKFYGYHIYRRMADR
ncbi:MAG: hypothetical protein ACYCS0_00845 [bacterium]